MLSEVSANKERPEGRSYWPSSVSQHTTLQTVVERKFLLLSPNEFARRFGARHSSKLPKVPQVQIRGLDGSVETCFAFKAGDDCHRSLKIVSIEGEELASELMAPEAHHHAEQGQKTLEMRHQSRMSDSHLARLLDQYSHASLTTMQEYEARCPLT